MSSACVAANASTPEKIAASACEADAVFTPGSESIWARRSSPKRSPRASGASTTPSVMRQSISPGLDLELVLARLHARVRGRTTGPRGSMTSTLPLARERKMGWCAPGRDEAAVADVARRHERQVVVAAHPAADVLVDDAVHRGDDVASASSAGCRRSRAYAAACAIIITRPELMPWPETSPTSTQNVSSNGEEVVEVTADVVGRLHAGRDLEARERRRDRQDRGLDPVRDLHLAAERLGALQLVARALDLAHHHVERVDEVAELVGVGLGDARREVAARDLRHRVRDVGERPRRLAQRADARESRGGEDEQEEHARASRAASRAGRRRRSRGPP